MRAEIASLLGYDSWAAYVLENRMAKKRENVERFLLDLQSKLDAKARIDMQLLSRAKQQHTGDATVHTRGTGSSTPPLAQDRVRDRRLRSRELLPARARDRRPLPRHPGATRHPIRARGGRPRSGTTTCRCTTSSTRPVTSRSRGSTWTCTRGPTSSATPPPHSVRGGRVAPRRQHTSSR